jgi:glycosyltransferase involved in cell wall biosynthesis
MRVVMVSKACVIGIYQKKLEELASFPGIDLTVIVPPYWREKGRRIHLERTHTENYQLVVEDLVLNGHFHVHFYPRLGPRLRSLQPDILHIDEEPYNLATFHATRLAVQLGAQPLFFTWQNLLRRYPFPFGWMERYNYSHAAYAISGNRDGVAVLRTKGYQGPVTVIPQFGVDAETFRAKAASDAAHPESFHVGYVGRLVEEKGVDLLLEAAGRLEGDWRLSILGDGPFEARLLELSRKLGLGERVAFLRPLPSPEMPAYYRQLDVLVLPSRTARNWKEQFGRVLIEAMASGTPVVGSTCGEIPNVIDEAGLLFSENDVQSLTAHLTRLMRDRELAASLARRGRERILKHYTQRRIAEDTHKVYLRVMGDGDH